MCNLFKVFKKFHLKNDKGSSKIVLPMLVVIYLTLESCLKYKTIFF